MTTPPPTGMMRVRRLTSGRVGRVVARSAAVVILVLLVLFVVAPQYGDAQRALQSVGELSPFPLVLGLVLELASLAAFGALTRVALDPTTRPSFATVLRIDVTGVGVTNSVPGGGATSLAVRYGLLVRSGVRSGAVAGALAVEAIVSNLLLGAILGAGVLLSLGSLPSTPYLGLAGGFIIVIFGTAAGALVQAVRHPAGAIAMTRSVLRRLSVARQDRAVAFVEAVVSAVAAFAADRRRLAAAVSWGATNWLLDVAALWVLLAAFGTLVTPGHLLLAYGLASILALVPITPGGLGVIEGVLVPTLVALGSPYAGAVLGVTAWRLLQFWMPIPLGAISAISLVAGSRRASLDRAR